MGVAVPWRYGGVLDVPDGTLTYDVRGDLRADPSRALLLVGFPMDASGFVSLASHFGDRPVVTYDPRTTGRSSKARGGFAAALRDALDQDPT